MAEIFLGTCPTTFEPLHVATVNGSWWLRGLLRLSRRQKFIPNSASLYTWYPLITEWKVKDSIVNCTRVHGTFSTKLKITWVGKTCSSQIFIIANITSMPRFSWFAKFAPRRWNPLYGSCNYVRNYTMLHFAIFSYYVHVCNTVLNNMCLVKHGITCNNKRTCYVKNKTHKSVSQIQKTFLKWNMKLTQVLKQQNMLCHVYY